MNLNPRFILGDLDLTDWPFMVEFGSDVGSPENVTQIIESMLPDGDIVSVSRASNRVLTLAVIAENADLDALAQAEELLALEASKPRNVLAIDPGDGFGAVTAFDTFAFQPRFVRKDEWEEQGYRRYELQIPALPFGRSEDEVIDEALTSSASPSTTVIADGTSATGWTSPDGAITSSGGVLVVPTAYVNSTYDGTGWRTDHFMWQADKTLSATDFTVTPYLSADTAPEPSAGTRYSASVSAFVDGSEVAGVAARPAGGPTRSTFLVSDSAATALSLRGTVAVAIYIVPWTSGGGVPPPVPTVTVDLDNVQRSNVAPTASSTGRESVRTIQVQGSARTEGRLQIGHETAGLGDVLVYTGPEGGAVPLRQWRTSGGAVTSDSAMVSGSKETTSVDVVFDVPTAGLPRGGYLLYARVDLGAIPGTASLSATATTRLNSVNLGEQATESGDIAAGSGWTIVPVGDFTLPVTDVPQGSVATVRVSLDANGADLDEAWLFYAGDGAALTQVACGAGSPATASVHNRLWVDTASLSRTEPAVWVGTQQDRSDAVYADLSGTVASWGVHSFAAGPLWAFLVTTGATYAGLTLTHPPRWHTHARALS